MKRITKEDREIIAKTCPKFNRICACYCNNPEYGVTLSPKAKRALNAGKNSVKSKEKTKVVSARVDVDDMERLNAYLKANGMTVAEFIKGAVKNIDGT